MTWGLRAGPFPDPKVLRVAMVLLQCTDCGRRKKGLIHLDTWSRAAVTKAMKQVEERQPCGCTTSSPTQAAAADAELATEESVRSAAVAEKE